MAPMMNPATMPTPATMRAMFALGSRFDFATPPRIRPTGPKMIGRISKAITPQTIPAMLNPLPAACC